MLYRKKNVAKRIQKKHRFFYLYSLHCIHRKRTLKMQECRYLKEKRKPDHPVVGWRGQQVPLCGQFPTVELPNVTFAKSGRLWSIHSVTPAQVQVGEDEPALRTNETTHYHIYDGSY